MNDWNGKQVLIIGAARQGTALARYMAQNGAVVTLNDRKEPAQLETIRQSMSALPVQWVFGSHDMSLLEGKDMVCISGGVSFDLPIVQEARQRGIPVSNDSQIFMERVPCPVIGITGSAGKTTTTTLVGRMVQAFVKPPHHSWVGGNIGLPLIDQLAEIKEGDRVVLELSSFQLELMTLSPAVASILNITPNHLDRHGTMEAYTAAKAHILNYQTSRDTAVLNREDAGSWGLLDTIKGKLVTFGLNGAHLEYPGTYFQDGNLCLFDGNTRQVIMSSNLIQLRGQHNLVNALAACAIAHAAGLDIPSMQAGITGFSGVAHRLEYVDNKNGAAWYNDSIATAPERTIAAIRSFDEPLVLLLGGRDKNLPWESLAALIHQRVDHVVLFGEAADKIQQALGPAVKNQRPYSISRCTGLQEAVSAAAEVARPGDVVLLSPGGTSYDQFKDFEERGEKFRLWVKQLP